MTRIFRVKRIDSPVKRSCRTGHNGSHRGVGIEIIVNYGNKCYNSADINVCAIFSVYNQWKGD